MEGQTEVNGVPTSEEVRAQFRAHYLLSGNAKASGKAVGLPKSTAHDIARELSSEPEFGKARAELRANAIDEVERSLMEVVRVGLARFKAPPPEIDIPEGSGAVVNITDKRCDYGALVINAHKAIVGRTRLEAEKGGELDKGPAVVINMPGATVEESTTPPDGA